jgi:uncharacterized protein YcbK (DUF882 family)
MNRSPWLEFFSENELKCKCGECGSTGKEMDPQFMNIILNLRQELRFPFVISSAYRCSKHNSIVSHTGPNGPHTTGRAIDVLCWGNEAFALADLAFQFGITGVGINQKGYNKGRFIHLDNLISTGTIYRPFIWSY